MTRVTTGVTIGPMASSPSSFASATDGIQIATLSWTQAAEPIKGVVQIAHGLAEHAARYDRLATALNAAGFLAYG